MGPRMAISKAVAVFLGPSLPRSRAAEILDADYYPPARMGDVYRLVASGVRIIVLIDGIFRGAAAVWHRELLEAMDHGICVIGASSMGALRAAELHTFGMIGVGTIFEWYRDGLIDGDDEVALLHSDADDGYRLLSQPLVNTRYRLQTAVERGELTPQEAREAIAHVKKVPFMWRTHGELLASEVVARWPDDARRCVKSMLDDANLDLKARDAERVLEYASARLARGEVRPPIVDRPAPSRYYRATSKRKRGLRHPNGHFVRGEEIWDQICSDRTLVRRCLAEAATRFYLGSLAEYWEVRCPDEYVNSIRSQWDARHRVDDLGPWLVANGLTVAERRELLRQHALVSWMIEQGPATFGLDFSLFSRLPELWARRCERNGSKGDGCDDDETRAAKRCFLAAWARVRGIRCPDTAVERTEEQLGGVDARTALGMGIDQWRLLVAELACSDWIVHQQPYRFGHSGWAPITAVLEELQITGRAAQLVADSR